MSPLGPPQQYIVKYNTFQLPGYAQSQTDDSNNQIVDHYSPYRDGSNSEYTGLTNKDLTMVFRLWEPSWRDCKDQYTIAATYLRSQKKSFAPLYVDYTDRHYEAKVKAITWSQDISRSRKIMDYTVEWTAKPYMISNSGYSLTGTGTIDTDSSSPSARSLLVDGGWTPTRITVTGTNITISGYNELGDFCGYVSISGAVSNLVMDTDAFSVTPASGINSILWKDFAIYVGPGKTTFVTTGASAVLIEYSNRWY